MVSQLREGARAQAFIPESHTQLGPYKVNEKHFFTTISWVYQLRLVVTLKFR